MALDNPTKRHLAKLQRAYRAARIAEAKAIEALDNRKTEPTKADYDRCWELAAKTNEARKLLNAALDAIGDKQ